MRDKNRIIPFLEAIKGKFTELFTNIYKLPISEMVIDRYIDKFYDNEVKIEKFWLSNPDLRFSQVLINLGIIPNVSGFWYYMEEDEILERLGIEPREYLLWGQNYDKNMNLLPNTVYKLIKDLRTDHIQAILDGGYVKNSKYSKCFEEELKLRSKNKEQ